MSIIVDKNTPIALRYFGLKLISWNFPLLFFLNLISEFDIMKIEKIIIIIDKEIGNAAEPRGS